MSARGRYRQHGRNVPPALLNLPLHILWAAWDGRTGIAFPHLAYLLDYLDVSVNAGAAVSIYERRYGKWRRVTERYARIASW